MLVCKVEHSYKPMGTLRASSLQQGAVLILKEELAKPPPSSFTLGWDLNVSVSQDSGQKIWWGQQRP